MQVLLTALYCAIRESGCLEKAHIVREMVEMLSWSLKIWVYRSEIQSVKLWPC